MRRTSLVLATLAAAAIVAACATSPGDSGGRSGPAAMTFFITSANAGRGADFGGLEGADRHCRVLAQRAGSPRTNWRAYLSTQGGPGGVVHARDRIGRGPWHNVRGDLIARNVDELHGNNGLTKQTALTERGTVVSGRGDSVNLHDILTGSSPEGRAVTNAGDTTCSNWTSAMGGSAIVGHHDRIGLRDDAPSRSWNSSHGTRGCNMESLQATGGGGLLYCFAAN